MTSYDGDLHPAEMTLLETTKYYSIVTILMELVRTISRQTATSHVWGIGAHILLGLKLVSVCTRCAKAVPRDCDFHRRF